MVSNMADVSKFPSHPMLPLLMAAAALAWSLPPGNGAQDPTGQPKPKAPAGTIAAAAQAAKSSAARQAKLDRANAYLNSGRFEDARKIVEPMLDGNPSDADAAGILGKSLHGEDQLTVQRQNLTLDEADWQQNNADHDKALAAADKVMGAATDSAVLDRAASIEKAARPGKLEQYASKFGSWLEDAVLAILLLLALWGFLRLIRHLYARNHSAEWLVEDIQDSTNLGAGVIASASLLAVHSGRGLAEPVSAGLLKLQALPLPSATALLLKDAGDNAVAKSLADLQIHVGAVDVGALVKFFQGLQQWFKSDLPRVSGSAFMIQAATPQVFVRLTGRGPDGNSRTVAASVDVAADPDAARAAAERAAFKMYYLIAMPTADEAAANGAESLRDGLGFLQSYVDGQDATKLTQALDKFQAVRTSLRDLWDAYLYEGVTLDLLERHDDAILRFEYVERNAKDAVLRQKAKYNRAVAHMRKYRPEDLIKAYELFDELSAGSIDVLQHPIKVLAKVGKANTRSHYLIFWDFLLNGRWAADDHERLTWKVRDKSTVEGWMAETQQIARDIDGYLQTIDAATGGPKTASAWDEQARRQLEWGKLNAEGNSHLNYATGFCQLPWQPSLGDEQALQKEHLESALKCFRNSEMALQPGVETLTNVATTYIYLGQFGDARNYLNQTIRINPSYEYAYYRMAMSWDRENRPLKVVEVLTKYATPVRLKEFKDLFQKYQVPLPE
jgi:tetratricopeptide (TPR) repeat protein